MRRLCMGCLQYCIINNTDAAAPQDYKPEFHFWRLVLLTRKCCLCAITVLADKNAMFQVRGLLVQSARL